MRSQGIHEAGIPSDLIRVYAPKREELGMSQSRNIIRFDKGLCMQEGGHKARSQGMTRGRNIIRFDQGSGSQEAGDKPGKSDARGRNIIRFDQGSGSQEEGDKPEKSSDLTRDQDLKR